ncbi:MAG TPA: META domain-containing protein [Microbacteriaceae bacterium]|nr:META domain-containing protein [Microbacteriaceae bacterium]
MKTMQTLAAVGVGALALTFSLAGCAPATPSGPGGDASSAVGTWGSDAQGEPNLSLTEDGKLSGTDGCNRLTGSWTQDGATVDFGQVASTMMFCEGVDTWLIDLSTGTVEGSTLHILDADGVEIGTLSRG